MTSNLTHDEYTSMVDRGQWPGDPFVPLAESFVNKNGIIQNLVLKPVTTVTVIKSHAGTVRSNHYHKTDWHYIYVVSGKVLYLERPVGSLEIPEPTIFLAGTMFFTPPMREHSVIFPEKTELLTMAKNIRSHESHESDLVRVEFIRDDMINDFLSKIR